MSREAGKQHPRSIGVSVILIGLALILLAVLSGYSAAYVGLSTVEDVSLPPDGTPHRFRHFEESWQAHFFLPASGVEALLVRRTVALLYDDSMIWSSYPQIEP